MAGKRDERQPVQASDLKESVIAALKKELLGEQPPEGWHSISEIAAMLEINFACAARLAKRKKWTEKNYTTVTADNRRLKVKHYHVQ